MSVVEKKIRSFLSDKLDLDLKYKAIIENGSTPNTPGDSRALLNLYEFDKLCYLYHALKSYYDTSKCKWDLDYRNILHDLSNLIQKVEAKLPVDDILETHRQLAVIRRQYKENAAEGGRVAFAMVLLAMELTDLTSMVQKFLGKTAPAIAKANRDHISASTTSQQQNHQQQPQQDTPATGSSSLTEKETYDLQQRKFNDLIRAPLAEPQHPAAPDLSQLNGSKRNHSGVPLPGLQPIAPAPSATLAPPADPGLTPSKRHRPHKYFSDLNNWTREHVKCAYDAVLENPERPNDAIILAFRAKLGIELTPEAAYTLRSHYGMIIQTMENFQYYNQAFNVVASQFYSHRLKYVTVPWADLKIQYARKTGLSISDEEIKGRYDLFLHHRQIYGSTGEPPSNYVDLANDFKKRYLKWVELKTTAHIRSAAASAPRSPYLSNILNPPNSAGGSAHLPAVSNVPSASNAPSNNSGAPIPGHPSHLSSYPQTNPPTTSAPSASSPRPSFAPNSAASSSRPEQSQFSIWNPRLVQFLIEAELILPLNAPRRVQLIQKHIELRSGGMLMEESEILEKLLEPYLQQAITRLRADREQQLRNSGRLPAQSSPQMGGMPLPNPGKPPAQASTQLSGNLPPVFNANPNVSTASGISHAPSFPQRLPFQNNPIPSMWPTAGPLPPGIKPIAPQTQSPQIQHRNLPVQSATNAMASHSPISMSARTPTQTSMQPQPQHQSQPAQQAPRNVPSFSPVPPAAKPTSYTALGTPVMNRPVVSNAPQSTQPLVQSATPQTAWKTSQANVAIATKQPLSGNLGVFAQTVKSPATRPSSTPGSKSPQAYSHISPVGQNHQPQSQTGTPQSANVSLTNTTGTGVSAAAQTPSKSSLAQQGKEKVVEPSKSSQSTAASHFDDLMVQLMRSQRSDDHYRARFRKLDLTGFWDFERSKTLVSTVDFISSLPTNTTDTVYRVAKMNLLKVIVLRLLRIHHVKVHTELIESRLMKMMEQDVFEPDLVRLINEHIFKNK